MTQMLIAPIRPSREFAISLLSGNLKAAAESVPEDLLRLSGQELEDIRTPTTVDYLLRKSFWKQVELAYKTGETSITAASIYDGICTKQNWEHKFVPTPYRIAWLLCYPETHMELMENGLTIGVHNLLKFIAKEPDRNTASAFIKAIDLLLNRVHGPVIQKIQAQHAHAHMNLNKPLASNETPEEAMKKLEDLRAQLMAPRDVSGS
jgi:hypothetical protein